jgi:hypothetical protein
MEGKPKKRNSTKKKSEDNNLEQTRTDYCPKCNRPFYYYPMYQTSQPVPTTNNLKSSNKLIYAGLIVVIFCIILFLGAIFGMIVGTDLEPEEEYYKTDVSISQGGHYKFSIEGNHDFKLEIDLDIKSEDNKTFNIFIMEMDQYDNSYGRENQSVMAFSTIYSKLNITHINETLKLDLPQWAYEYFIIIDNSDIELLTNDAAPNGPINIKFKISKDVVSYLK